jgi:hypothetical protein
MFSWTSNPPIGLSSGSGNAIPSFTATNKTDATINSIITVTPSSNGCIGTPMSYTMSVLPESKVGDPIPSETQVCSGGSATISLSDYTPGANIQWQSKTTGTYADITTPSGTTSVLSLPLLSTTTTYRARVTMPSCTISAFSDEVIITVDPITVAGTATPAATTICSGNSASITLGGGYVGSIQWQSSPNGSTYTDIPGETNLKHSYVIEYNLLSSNC